jgi:hypothetical protein
VGKLPRFALLVLVGLLHVGHACAGEEAEHRFLIYSLALGAGFSPEDSRTLADASWSQDTNLSTVAFSGMSDVMSTAAEAAALTKDPARMRALMTDDEAIDREFTEPAGAFRRIASTAMVHSIVHDPQRLRSANPELDDKTFHPEDARIRGNLDAAYHRYLREQVAGLRESGDTPEGVHTAGLLIAGQYLHQFVDAYAHPEDAVVGHAREGHPPDEAWADPERFKTAAFWTLRELKILRGSLETTDERGSLFALSSDADQKAFADEMVDALIRGYDPSVARKIPGVGYVMGLAPSELSEKDKQRFTRELEKSLNSSRLRRHPTFQIHVPPYTKVEYTLSEDGRMQLSYERMENDLELDDFVQWVYADPQFEDLRAALRGNVRGYIRDYPMWANQRLQELKEARTALDARLQGTKQSMQEFFKGRAGVDRTSSARNLAMPVRDLNQERVAAQKAADAKAAQERAEANAEAEAAKQQGSSSRTERETSHSGPDHSAVRRRVCSGVGVLCD